MQEDTHTRGLYTHFYALVELLHLQIDGGTVCEEGDVLKWKFPKKNRIHQSSLGIHRIMTSMTQSTDASNLTMGVLSIQNART